MPAAAIPWYDQAALIRTSGEKVVDGGRAIAAEGELHQIVEIASCLLPSELDRYFIALPDRRSAPHRFEGDAFIQLLGRIDRPGAGSFVGW